MQRGFYVTFRFLAIFSISSPDNSPSAVNMFVSVDHMTPALLFLIMSSPCSETEYYAD